MTWSEAFGAFLKRHGIKASEAATVLGVSGSKVHYWLRGAEPRGEKGMAMKRRIELWSRGEILAAPWKEPASSTDLSDNVEHRSAG
jgi:hypothetical protein